MHLVEHERLTPDEIARLKKLINDLDQPRRRG
jgi:predicted transcriptional regulator